MGTLGTEFYNYLKKDNDVYGIDWNEWRVAEINDSHIFLGDYTKHKGTYDLVIHTAAYKHIDLCEKNKEMCSINNVFNLVIAYKNIKARRWLFISSDKAVEPSSFYGVTKQIGEQYFTNKFQYVVRLGNIWASSGSVIPIWEKNAREGFPLPITDLAMTRYFIKVDDAVKKIWALYQIAKPGQVIIPAMGRPKKLRDIVGKLYPNVKIKIIGLRKGEKMREKLSWDYETIKYKDKNGVIV